MSRFRSLKKILVSATLVILCFILTTACSSSRRTIAVEEGWEILGERKVDFVTDKDQITVSSRNEFTALRLRIEDREVRINYLKIYFRNGDVLQPAVNELIGANQNSRIIDLAKEGRPIDKIEFRYHTTGNLLAGRANVLVFGKKYYPGGY